MFQSKKAKDKTPFWLTDNKREADKPKMQGSTLDILEKQKRMPQTNRDPFTSEI